MSIVLSLCFGFDVYPIKMYLTTGTKMLPIEFLCWWLIFLFYFNRGSISFYFSIRFYFSISFYLFYDLYYLYLMVVYFIICWLKLLYFFFFSFKGWFFSSSFSLFYAFLFLLLDFFWIVIYKTLSFSMIPSLSS